MVDFEFRQLDESDEGIYRKFEQEFVEGGGRQAPGAAFAEELSYEEWLKKTRDYDRGYNLKDGHVQATIYFLIRKSDSKILGALDLRHRLSEYLLKFGGNIGYGVVPSERRKGYASMMVQKALKICKSMGMKKVLITCDKDNIASAKTIQKNGGTLENEVVTDEGVFRQRYWIKT